MVNPLRFHLLLAISTKMEIPKVFPGFYMAGIVRNDKVKIRIVIHVNKNTQKGIMYII
jgi:hypothetical protein